MSIVIPACVVGGLGLVFGLLLAYASKRFAVEVDEKVQQVRELLPGANCSGCGFPSCDAFAAAACEGKCKPSQCVVNTAENRKAIGALLGLDERAQVLCRTQLQAKDARKACKHACIRCRICEKNCPEQAISMEDGHIVVEPARCTHCGVCVEKCPTKAMSRLVP